MIRVDVEDYCHSCCDFSPDVTPPARMLSVDMTVTQTDTIIQCKYRRRCEAIKKYLLRQDNCSSVG